VAVGRLCFKSGVLGCAWTRAGVYTSLVSVIRHKLGHVGADALLSGLLYNARYVRQRLAPGAGWRGLVDRAAPRGLGSLDLQLPVPVLVRRDRSSRSRVRSCAWPAAGGRIYGQLHAMLVYLLVCQERSPQFSPSKICAAHHTTEKHRGSSNTVLRYQFCRKQLGRNARMTVRSHV
jgi:hypothetical protein